jgi:hypothetical protein
VSLRSQVVLDWTYLARMYLARMYLARICNHHQQMRVAPSYMLVQNHRKRCIAGCQLQALAPARHLPSQITEQFERLPKCCPGPCKCTCWQVQLHLQFAAASGCHHIHVYVQGWSYAMHAHAYGMPAMPAQAGWLPWQQACREPMGTRMRCKRYFR